MLKAAANSDYPHYDELKRGLESAKRVTDRINEAQRRSENAQTVASLEARVEDWKGHHLTNFGELILEDIFMVMKMDIDREYHVFLFEKIILCCKEVQPSANGTIRKNNKSNSILKKQGVPLSAGTGPSRKKITPLLLKGRIFLNNVTHTRHSITPGMFETLLQSCRILMHVCLSQDRLRPNTHSRFGGEVTMTTSTSPYAVDRRSN